MHSSPELTQKEKHLIKARHKYKTRRLDILEFLIKRPLGSSTLQIAQGIGVSLISAKRYIAKLKNDGDIVLLRSEPIKGVSRKPINYYAISNEGMVVLTEGELDGLLKKSY